MIDQTATYDVLNYRLGSTAFIFIVTTIDDSFRNMDNVARRYPKNFHPYLHYPLLSLAFLSCTILTSGKLKKKSNEKNNGSTT